MTMSSTSKSTEIVVQQELRKPHFQFNSIRLFLCQRTFHLSQLRTFVILYSEKNYFSSKVKFVSCDKNKEDTCVFSLIIENSYSSCTTVKQLSYSSHTNVFKSNSTNPVRLCRVQVGSARPRLFCNSKKYNIYVHLLFLTPSHMKKEIPE